MEKHVNGFLSADELSTSFPGSVIDGTLVPLSLGTIAPSNRGSTTAIVAPIQILPTITAVDLLNFDCLPLIFTCTTCTVLNSKGKFLQILL